MNNHEEIDAIERITEKWLRDCRAIFSDLKEPVGAVIVYADASKDIPSSMVIVKEGGVVVLKDFDHSKTVTVNSLESLEIHALCMMPRRGPQLQSALDRMANTEADAKLGERLHAQLVAELAYCSFDSQFKAIERVDADAKALGGLVGRCFTQPAADGHAHYQVTSVAGDQVRVQHLHVMDGYSISAWGADAKVDKKMVEDIVRQQDSYAAAVARNARSRPR